MSFSDRLNCPNTAIYFLALTHCRPRQVQPSVHAEYYRHTIFPEDSAPWPASSLPVKIAFVDHVFHHLVVWPGVGHVIHGRQFFTKQVVVIFLVFVTVKVKIILRELVTLDREHLVRQNPMTCFKDFCSGQITSLERCN